MTESTATPKGTPGRKTRRSSKAALAAIPTQPGYMLKFSPWTEDVGAEIAHRVAMGETIPQICSEPGKPGASTVYHWAVINASFRDALARARELAADRYAEQQLHISDEAAINPTHEGVGAARIRMQARQWLASKYRPQSYGDKLDVVGDLQLTTIIRKFSGQTYTQAVDVDAQVAIEHTAQVIDNKG